VEIQASHVGLQIGQHLPSNHMHRILEGFDEWKDLPPERIEIKMSDAVDQLKFNRMKQYENNLNLDSEEETNQLLSYVKKSQN
jgi:hypothetical protein